jgi:hypothetical protein
MIGYRHGVTYVRCYTSNGRDDSSIKRTNTTLSLVHVDQRCPHARELLRPLSQLRKAGRLDRQACPYDVERVCEENRGDTGDTTADESLHGREILAGILLEYALGIG